MRHHIRDVTFGEDAATSRIGRGPVNLATIRAAVIAAFKDAGYLHVPEGRRDHTTPAETSPPPRPRLRQMRTFTEYAGALGRNRQSFLPGPGPPKGDPGGE